MAAVMSIKKTTGLPSVCQLGDDFDISLTIKNDAARTNHEINYFRLYIMDGTGDDWQTDGIELYNFPDDNVHHYFFTPGQTRKLSFSFNLSGDYIKQAAVTHLQSVKHARIAVVFIYDTAGSFVVHEFGTILYKRVNPRIEEFDVDRISDESTKMIVTLKITTAADADTSGLALSIRYSKRDGTSTGTISLSQYIDDAFDGITEQQLFSNDFATGDAWVFTAILTNYIDGETYEVPGTSLPVTVLQSFGNMYLSGYEGGGVSFGRFGRSNVQNGALFECYYPAEFNAGIKGVTNYSASEELTGGKWIDGKDIYRNVVQFTSLATGSRTITEGVPQNVDTLISLRGMGYRTNPRWHTIPSAATAGTSEMIELWYGASGGQNVIHINIGSSLSTLTKGFIIMEYTKTE